VPDKIPRPQAILLGDIGGSNARFAWVVPGSTHLQGVAVYECAAFVRFVDTLVAYRTVLRELGDPRLLRVVLAVAASVHEDRIRLTNFPWQFSRRELQAQLGVPVAVLNDFSAQAWCLPALAADFQPALPAEALQWWQRPGARAEPMAKALARSIVGPGTGFGAATLTAGGEVLESEPGHVGFAPGNAHELALLGQLWQRYPRISAEHLLSGPGLANLYWANSRLLGGEKSLSAPQIVAAAERGDALALQSIEDFTGILGAVCGDIALAMGSRGGLILSGGMLERMDPLLNKALFMARFSDKGPFSQWCTEVPVARLTLPWPGLTGCALYCRIHHAGLA
jgi:glucokinase